MTTPFVIVLAGGANSRFWPLREKSLLPMLGRTLLRRHVDALAQAGIEAGAVVGTPANADLLRAELAPVASPILRVVVQPEPRGMGDAVLSALRALPADGQRPVLVTQVHDLFDGDLLARVVAAHAADSARSYLAAYRAPTYFPGGYFVVRDGRAVGLIEKPPPEQTPSDLVSIVIRLHRDPAGLARALAAAYAAGGPDDHYERAIAAQMAEHDHALVVHEGRWAAIKYPWHVLDAADLLLQGIDAPVVADSARVDAKATVTGKVVIAPGARLFAGAAVVGPAYIGADTIVGNNALVRQAVVEARCVVGYGSEVARSYVGPGCWFHTNYIGDSVIGPESTFGSGAVTANLRQDHRAIRATVRGERIDTGRDKLGLVCGRRASFGVQAATMPGVQVGEGSIIGPGVILYRDVPDGRRLRLKQELEETSPPAPPRSGEGS